MAKVLLGVALVASLSFADCYHRLLRVEVGSENINLAIHNSTLPRKYQQSIQIGETIREIEKKIGRDFFNLVGFTSFEFTAGPGAGQARSLASHITKHLSRLDLSSDDKAMLWRQSIALFKVLNAEWEMAEIKGSTGHEYVFQGSTPSLPGSDGLPVILFAEDGSIYRGSYPRLSDSVPVPINLKDKLEKR